MPKAAPKPCSYPGCGVLVHDGSARCAKHPREAWAKTHEVKRRSGRWLQRARERLFSRAPLCAECQRQGRVRVATERDHIVPLAEFTGAGDPDGDDNVQGLCAECHEAKRKVESARGQARRRAGSA